MPFCPLKHDSNADARREGKSRSKGVPGAPVYNSRYEACNAQEKRVMRLASTLCFDTFSLAGVFKLHTVELTRTIPIDRTAGAHFVSGVVLLRVRMSRVQYLNRAVSSTACRPCGEITEPRDGYRSAMRAQSQIWLKSKSKS
jgi:hypothetical protein